MQSKGYRRQHLCPARLRP